MVLSYPAMLYLPISRSWMISRAAQRVYLVTAILNLALLATWIGVLAATLGSGYFVLPQSTALLINLMFLPEILGTAVLLVGMAYFFCGFDRSSEGKRALWFLLLYFLNFLVLPFYYFLIYRSLVKTEGTIPANPPTPE
jgi:hypothetical protein